MPKCNFTKSYAIRGDIGATFDTISSALTKFGFEESSATWPSDMEFKRGKKGMFAKNLKEVKTELKVSLRQSSDYVNILFDYSLAVPGSYVKSDNELEDEFAKIKHELSGIKQTEPKTKVCDVCMVQLEGDQKFCKNCGRSTSRQKTETVDAIKETDVYFDETRIAFGQKIVDDALYGGIPKHYQILLTSPPAEEKDAIITRFIETGLDNDETVVNITGSDYLLNNSKISTDPNFYQVLCHPNAEGELSRKTNDNLMTVKGAEKLTDLSIAFTSLLNKISKNEDDDPDKPKRMIIDILSDVLLSNSSINTRKWLRETMTKFKNKNFTGIATLNPFMHPKEDVHALLDLFDGHIELYEMDQSPNVSMRIRRMNNCKYSKRVIDLSNEDYVVTTKS